MMSFKEFKATVSTARVAGPQKEINTITTKPTVKNHSDSSKEHTKCLTSTSNTTSSSTSSSTSSLPSASSTTMLQQEQQVKMCKLFTFLEDTYRDIRRFNSGLYKDSYSTQLMQSINKYKNGCNEIFAKVLESNDMSFMLSQNIVRTIDIFKELGTCLTDMEEYQYRICEIMSIFIVCELRLSVDANPQEQLSIAHRIIYIMRRHLVQEEEQETLYNILRTLVYIPKLYNARDIMCAIFGEFIPIKPVPEVNVLPDKLYMLYIIVFYRWMMMQKDDDDKLLIVNFAESFMKPSVSLCSNNLYGAYLPMYTTHSTATRTILNNLKFYRDIRNASIIDNALKSIGSIVNLCDDDDDEDVIVIDSSPAPDFAKIFASALLEPLNGSLTNIKLEEKTVVGLVDLTMEEEPSNSQNSIIERHDKWLNEFQQLAKQYREAQLLLEKQQHNQLNASREKETVICLDSDSEEEAEEEISAAASKEKPETAAAEEAAATQNKPCEDLFIDNYPLTNTPIHCDTDLESLDDDDNDDATKISSRFFTGTLRTYQAKKTTLSETEDTNHSDADESNNRSLTMNNAYRRDSIHISSSPPDGVDNEEDEGTDVQDEHDDGLLDEEDEEEEEEEEDNAYTFLPTTSKQTESAIRPMGPYPTYNNMHNNNNSNNHNDKLVLSQSLSRYQPDKQYYSDSSEIKAHSRQKKRVQFNTSPLGPTASSTANLKMPLKPALQQQKYKAADAPEYFHLRGFERFPGGLSVASSTSTSISTSTSSSIKHQEQQEHLAAAATLFRNIFDRPRVPYPYPASFSPSSSSLSSPKTSRLPKNKLKQRRPTIAARGDLNNMKLADNNHTERFSIIRNREVLNDGYHSTGPPGMSCYVESSDDCYGVASDSDIFINERYNNDAKLRKRCAVVIKPTKELLQYERKRDEMYNEILIKQRRKLELRTMAKQREKERRRLSKEKKEQTQSSDKGVTDAAIERVKDRPVRRKSRNFTEIFMSSESEFETNFQVRTRKQRQQILPDLQPLNIEIGATDAATTSSLLSQIDAHLNSPQKSKKQLPKQQPSEQATSNDSDINQTTCDINDPGQQTKMRELNLLADIAQHLSPYQLQLPETDKNNQPPRTPLPAPDATPTPKPKEKITVTEHLIIISSCNLLETTQTQPQPPQVDIDEQQQQATIPSYAHEPKLNIAAILNSSPSEKSLLNQNPQNNTPLETNDNNTLLTNNVPHKGIQTEETLEQILEESISVLKSVTSPFNPLNECTAAERAETQSESTIPLLISNVESLNRYEPNNVCVAKQKPDDKEHLLSKETTNENSEKLVLNANGETNEKPKDLMMEETDNESANVLSSTILNNVESSILCAADLSNISSETEISQGIKVPSLMTADLSDISLESEISKNLPDIAEPSPVVTDMSDNSNESCVSKTFGLQTPISNNNTTTYTAEVPVMSLPDLSFVMPSLTQPPAALPTNQQDCLERNFNHLNSTLNTPIKLADMPRAEEAATNPLNDLNTPLKFALAPAELENHNTPENDNNVTKFLDLILNKTVTDAESETRDKIIKELNALTADTTATATDTSETGSNNEITTNTSETGSNTEITPPVETATATDTSETGSNNEITSPVETATATDTSETGSNNEITPPVETELTQDSGHKTMETKEAVLDKDSVNFDKSLEQTNELKDQENDTTLDNSNDSPIENHNSSKATENNDVSLTLRANPAKEILKEDKTPTELLSEAAATTTELRKTPTSPIHKIKAAAIKQTFKIKCRVRLKRLNIDEHSKSSKKKTWMAIPITKPEEPDKSANNDMKNCDNMTETKSLLKKTCLKPNNKRTIDESENKSHESLQEVAPTAADVTTAKKPKLEHEQTTSPTEVTTSKKPKLEHEQTTTPTIETTPTALIQQQPQLQSPAVALSVSVSPSSTPALPLNNNPIPKKSKSKHLKTVTFDLSNLNEELRGTSSFNHKHKSKNHTAGIAAGALGCYLKNSRPPRKLPDNTLRAAETLQLFVNTINDSTRTPPPAEFNKKRSPIKNKCIAEDETPRPPPASTLMDTPPCKKVCTEKSRSQISSSKCKDQLVSSLATASISTISSDITTARIYTSSPLDQTLPEYDDNVDTVADSELILPNTAGSLRRKLKRPKKSLTRPVPVDDISTDGISNQPECNGEDDTDAVADNEDDVFAEELLPIPAANEHILEEIVSARPSHIGSGTVIRDDYMNIEATATVPVYLFNDESRDLATPEPIQSSGDTTNVVDSSSYLNSSSSAATHNAMQTATASTTSSSSSSSLAMGNLEKSMLSPSEHEVSSTQETFYQTPTKSKQTGEGFGEKSSTSKDKGVGGSSTMSSSQKQKPEDSDFQNKDDQTSSTTGLLQNNQVDTTNHSPEMCTLALTPTTTTSPAMTSNHKIRKASTHDEILFNELQQQQQQQAPTKRKNTTTTTSCAESTSDNNSKTNNVMSNTPDDNKSNRSLNKEHKLKKLLKEACKRDKNLSSNELVDAAAGVVGAVNTAVEGGGGSSPSTTTIINEEKLSSRSKRKKQKSSKSNKLKNHGERSTKIVLKASKLAAHVPTVNPLIITIPKSRLLRPPPTPTPSEDQQPQNEFLDIPNAKLFTEKDKDKVTTPVQSSNQKKQQPHHHHHQNPERTHSMEKKEWHQTSVNVSGKSKRTQSPLNTMSDIANIKSVNIIEPNNKDNTRNTNSTTIKTTIKEKSSEAAIIKKTLPEMVNKKSSNIVVGIQIKEVTHNTNSTTAATITSAAKEKTAGAAAIIKKKVKTSSTNNTTTTNTPTNNKTNSNNNVIFAKDKYDLIKGKEKQATNNEQQQEAHKEKLKDNKTSSHQTKPTTSSSSNIRLHKSSAKEKVKEKHKLTTDKPVTQTQNVLKLNINLSSNNKALNSLTSASNANSNVQKQSSSKFSKTCSSNSTASSSNAILKAKTNLSTQSLNTANAGSQITTPTSTSASSASASPSVTIATTNHVRKKLKTK
ncbi:mucin-2-like [Calliphora vicina]|uniref:mucin-2-like n=1 Tax=Calliphora vicina TaxID=7373 RepID=UPI00325ADA54